MKPKFKVCDIIESDSTPPRAKWMIVGFFSQNNDYYPRIEYFYNAVLLHSIYGHIKLGTLKKLEARIVEMSCILFNEGNEKDDE